MHERSAAADEVREHPDQGAADDRQPEGQRQSETGRRRWIQTVAEEPPKPGALLEASLDLLRRGIRRSLSDDRRREARAGICDERTGGERDEEEEDDGHDFRVQSLRCFTRVSAG